MRDEKYKLQDIDGKQVEVYVRPDKRLKKFSRWERQKDGSILLRIPYRFPKRQIGNLLDKVAVQIVNQKQMAERRTDAELQLRAQAINRKYFGGSIRWQAILGGEYGEAAGQLHERWSDRWAYSH
jgi:predicted metal-dependent hydrolase